MKVRVQAFDGDEMNLHAPQSYEASTELEEIAAIPHHIVTPRHAKPVIGVYQDTLVGSYRLTRPGVEFTRREFMNLMMWNKRFDGQMPVPRVGGERYTGQQVLSALLPPINLEMGNKSFDGDKEGKQSNNYVKIVQGDIQQGIVDDDIYMKPGKGVIHVTYNDYGPKDTVALLDSLQNTVESFLVMNGFSVGISDLVADDETKKSIDEAIQNRKKQIEQVLLQVHTDLFDNNTGKTNQQEFEDQVFSILNQATGDAGKAGKKSLSTENRLLAMVNAGSKGNTTNIAQMIACLGQQAIDGKRIAYGFTDRTLPHYKKYDDGAEARGFIESSFIRGLTPQEFFFHAMSGREGLIDTAVKTAETGYTQRQLIKAMEDLVVQHDGTVRDANMNIVQYHYGEDGVMATKIEAQALPLGKMSQEEIRAEFGMEGVDWANILEDGIVRSDDSEQVSAYVDTVLRDQRMIVEGVFQSGSLSSGVVNAPVNLARMILNTKVRFGLRDTSRTDLTPEYVLAGIDRIIQKTQDYNQIWSSLLRYNLAPHRLIVKERFTRSAFDALCELIVVSHMKAWVQPGEQVGIVAAQSIGEPATQMTLNSVDWNTQIVIAKNGKIMTPRIGEFIDNYYETCDSTNIQHLPNNQIYITLNDGNDWKAISCNENGNMIWTKLEALTRHPIINKDGTNTILEIELESGRKVNGTKAKSFLTLRDGKVKEIEGEQLKIGDVLPIALDLATNDMPMIDILNIRDILPPNEWLYGTEVSKALHTMKRENTNGNRHWFSHLNGVQFTVPYKRSDTFRDAFMNNKHSNSSRIINSNCVYPKTTGMSLTQIPEIITLDTEFGFFAGAYLAEGMSNQTQINITNNDMIYIHKIKELMDKWCIGTHIVQENKTIEKTNINGTTTSIIIHSTVLAKIMSSLFGRVSYEKDIPDWVLQAPDSFIKGLVDGYVSGDGTVDKRDYTIRVSSVSEKLIIKFCILMARYGIFTTRREHMPSIKKFNSVSMHYTVSLPVKYSLIFANHFTLTHKQKQLYLNELLKSGLHTCRRQSLNSVIFDKIKSIREYIPPENRVYDVTVETTRNFMTINCVNIRDTFHMSGVASASSVTRGVPRLRELLKVTKNPKATSLMIYMKPEFRGNKDKARELVQDLELTLLRNITEKLAIYWDPSDESSVIDDDRALLQFFRLFEASLAEEGVGGDISSEGKFSKWVLRLELDKEEMFNKNISMADVVFVIKNQFEDISVVYSDYNSDKLVMRIRVPKEAGDTASKLDDFTNLKKFQNKLLNSVVIRGVLGVKAVTFRKDEQKVELVDGTYQAVEQYILDTDGSNYVKVMNHPAVDASRLYTTNVHDIIDILGIEATRAILYNEISTLFEGVGVNYRHLGLLCDVITRSGRLMSIDRYGINKNDIGPLAKASFEETEKIMLRAALFGEVDPVTGVSSNIMTGQPIRGGTAFTQILLDEAALVRLSEGLGVIADEEAEEEGDITTLMEDGLQIADPCSSAQFQMTLALAPTAKGLDEEDVEIELLEAA